MVIHRNYSTYPIYPMACPWPQEPIPFLFKNSIKNIHAFIRLGKIFHMFSPMYYIIYTSDVHQLHHLHYRLQNFTHTASSRREITRVNKQRKFITGHDNDSGREAKLLNYWSYNSAANNCLSSNNLETTSQPVKV